MSYCLTVVFIKTKSFNTLNPEFTVIAKSICIDDKNRLWISSFNKKTKRSPNYENMIYEIFNDAGELLGKIKPPDKKLNYITRIFGDRAFFICFSDQCVYEYKIVDF